MSADRHPPGGAEESLNFRMGKPRRGGGAVLCLPLILLAAPSAAAPDFAREVRPILERSCFGCHGPEKQKSGYRLDVKDIAIKGGESGEAAMVPHDAGKSPLIRYVSGGDAEMQMPPLKSGTPPLTGAEVRTLRDWIDAGPGWPEELAGPQTGPAPQWSLQPLVASRPPQPAGHPVDAFLRVKLAAKGLTLTPEADRRTLMRRLYFDLQGLPPAPEEVAGFVQDGDPQAYEKLVDRLLASPRYGERWARHWLDTIHFADTHGFEHDDIRPHAWRFRDYVITSLNRDTPWDRFIREQIAADVFFPEETSLTAALGFLGAGTYDSSAAATAPTSFEYLDRDDLVTQTMASFVSTTVNCARCHAHKFDPVTQEDYFAVQAVFAGVGKGDVSYDGDPDTARQRRLLTELRSAVDRQDRVVLLSAESDALIQAWEQERGPATAWEPLVAEVFVSAEGAALERLADGSVLSGGPVPDKDSYTITATTGLTAITGLRLDLLTDDSLPMKGPGRAPNGNLHLSEIELLVFRPGAAKPENAVIRGAWSDFDQAGGYDVTKAIDGDSKSSWAIHPAVGLPHYAVFGLGAALPVEPGARLVVTLRQLQGGHLLGRFKLSATSSPAASLRALPAEAESALLTAPPERREEQKLALASYVLREKARVGLAGLPAPVTVWAASRAAVNERGVVAIPEPRTIRVLRRGDLDKPGVEATPGALSAVRALKARFELPAAADEAARRAALATWLADPANPLTWRSVVNRVWHYHFGKGLCDTPNDLGSMGGVPSHPELIDWLAVWFRDEARGSLKALHRLMVTSAAYRQGSTGNGAAAALDPDNRLLWRMNRPRLDADTFRDSLLAVSGRLDLTMGGPSVAHFTSTPGPQSTPVLNYENFDWDSPGASRRSIYRLVWRAIADPFMDALDFPDMGSLSPVRGFSASPLQSLALLNNEFVLRCSGHLATRLETMGATTEARIGAAFQLMFQRGPTAAETADFTAIASQHGLPAACRVLCNSNEFFFPD